jgi:two-component system OmpR family response regulator
MSDPRPEARLLVVEDEPNILELLSASLRLAGFEVATATGGLEASRPCSATAPTWSCWT